MAISFDFSLVIMWAYFTVYVIMFLIVSVLCAMEVHKEKEEKASICKLIRVWIISLWRKKKIYGELVPHFFDQATDIGVVVEFYSYYKKGLGFDEIGVNTRLLFMVSISIIVAHRVVSAIAVFNLTHKPMYAIYQLLDVLMIKCVYTNYKLNTNQPSNAQRYLQTMEAIFESAPQILISLAFLIKTTQIEISATVVASLATSLYSLSSNVSADDKVMLQEEWKEPLLRDINRKLEFPWINVKFLIRVFLWRFLEISSRISLLALTWINLGGKSIFFLVGLEFCYLAVLAWGLGTIDIMGNLIYLMAANSKRKGYRWAVPMAYVFWAYRVLSSWVLLMSITIYAATDIQYGNDILNNEGGATRYEQTFKNTAGLALFIYSWSATPIWQWVGAVVIFDYKNLASVGRDVETLLEDDKYDQVLELVSFGARFDPGIVLQKLERKRSVKSASDVSDVASDAGSVQSAVTPENRNCPGKHGLSEFKAENDGILCEICSDKCRAGDVLYGCRECNYDVCSNCNGKETSIVVCEKGHEIRKMATGYDKKTGYSGTYYCNICGTNSKERIAWHCDECEYDLCDKCYRKASRTSSREHGPNAMDQLANICKRKLEQDTHEVDAKYSGIRKVCECICSCGALLTIFACVFIGIGAYVYSEMGTSGDNFYLSVGALSIAGIMLFCAASCAFNLFEKANACCSNKKHMETSIKRKQSSAANINCPGEHGLSKFTTESDGYGCDYCKAKVNRGTILYGCRECNFDVCTDCKPEIREEAVEIDHDGKQSAKGGEIVCCDNKHPLSIHGPIAQYECNHCKKPYENEQSWYCKACNYDLCLDCFEQEQSVLSGATKKIIKWMKNRDVGEDKPVLQCGLYAFPFILGLAFLFGSDIAALLINAEFDCNIIGGSGYVMFNVYEFLQYGAIVHLSLLGVVICCGCCYLATDSETNAYAVACAMCCGFCFCVSWIVIGFLLHSEMNTDNVLDKQCIGMVYSWTIIKTIEFGGIPVLLCCLGLVAVIVDDFEDFMEILGQVCVVCCGGLCALGLLLGSDIAVLNIQLHVGCDSAVVDGASFFAPSTWIYAGSISHFGVMFMGLCCLALASDSEMVLGCFFCCCCIFFVTWAVLGFMMYGEMDTSTPDNKQCSDAVLSWNILKIVEFVLLPCCVLCVAAVSD